MGEERIDPAEFAGLLRVRRAEIVASLRQRAGDVRDIVASRSGATADDEHDPEGSTLSAEWSRVEGLRAAEAVQATEIDAALARIEDGSYGICVGCGTAIPVERLRARPMASMCVRCAS